MKTFSDITKINVSKHIEEINGFSYLSWSFAWEQVKLIDPNANYEILEDKEQNPFFESKFGIFVKTKVTVNNVTHLMILPVLNGANKAMKFESYTYQVYDKWKKTHIEKKVDAATTFDINKAILRCLVKNIAMHGLGLYIYQGEDLPSKLDDIDEIKQKDIQQNKTELSKKDKTETHINPYDDDKGNTDYPEAAEKETKPKDIFWLTTDDKRISEVKLQNNIANSFLKVCGSAETVENKQKEINELALKYQNYYQGLSLKVDWFNKLYQEALNDCKSF